MVRLGSAGKAARAPSSPPGRQYGSRSAFSRPTASRSSAGCARRGRTRHGAADVRRGRRVIWRVSLLWPRPHRGIRREVRGRGSTADASRAARRARRRAGRFDEGGALGAGWGPAGAHDGRLRAPLNGVDRTKARRAPHRRSGSLVKVCVRQRGSRPDPAVGASASVSGIFRSDEDAAPRSVSLPHAVAHAHRSEQPAR
jgi:hypothetical protein